ncbi:hypothetical protein O3P69_003836 [Scylla paramamosain]|uniref:Uncharacterized protein n=1 Tax=Scylla paramamosain TaxID=85552 RepID=A0AAW0UFX1_SCYPA
MQQLRDALIHQVAPETTVLLDKVSALHEGFTLPQNFDEKNRNSPPPVPAASAPPMPYLSDFPTDRCPLVSLLPTVIQRTCHSEEAKCGAASAGEVVELLRRRRAAGDLTLTASGTT